MLEHPLRCKINGIQRDVTALAKVDALDGNARNQVEESFRIREGHRRCADYATPFEHHPQTTNRQRQINLLHNVLLSAGCPLNTSLNYFRAIRSINFARLLTR